MNQIICHTSHLPQGQTHPLSFMELLLDDTWADGTIEYSEEIFSLTGPINSRLKINQNYEFLLRAAKIYPILAVGNDKSVPSPQRPDSWDAFCTDCYVVSKYQQDLKEIGYFDIILDELLNRNTHMPSPCPDLEARTQYLYDMLNQSALFYTIDDDTQPILVYIADKICADVLTSISHELVSALKLCHQKVEAFDFTQEGIAPMQQFIGKHYKAIIGIQSTLFSIMLSDNQTYLHDLIHAPKFNMLLDHPINLSVPTLPLQNYYLLTHDRNYLHFTKRFYPNVKDCFQFAPGAISTPFTPDNSRKDFDISFIGAYKDYRESLNYLYQSDSNTRHFAAKYLKTLKTNPNITAEKALELTLSTYYSPFNEKAFFDLFSGTRQAFLIIKSYYREKIIETILNAGITLHVFGDTWKNAPFENKHNLMIHPLVDVAESLDIMKRSKISLNIMSWHKDGFTERVVNAMACRSVLLSDKTTYLEEEFTNGQDLVLFDLKELEQLPLLIRSLLTDDTKCNQIALNGYTKIMNHHLWIHRAKQLLDIIQKLK